MYALVDCNNFFVSCERIFDPSLEGKAVVVLSNNDGCAVSRSNEAKAMGIKMGTPFFKLRNMTDSGRLIAKSSNYALYGDISARVMSIIADAVPEIEIYSIDEAYMVLKGFSPEQYIPLCRDIRAKIRKWVGIPVSIGIAPTKTLAKVACHFAKTYPGYHGVCAVDSNEKRLKALALTPIKEVWGIGRKLSPKLEAMGIKTALDFISRPEEWVRDRLNLPALRTWNELMGADCIAEERDARRQSICNSRSFAQMTDDAAELSRMVSDFAAMCAAKLRRDRSAAASVTVFLWTNRFREELDQYYPSATIKLEVPSSNTQEIVSAALKCFRTIWRPGYLYKKAGVIVSDISDAGQIQAELFDERQEYRAKSDKISQVMDRLNSKCRSGYSSVGATGNVLRLAVQHQDPLSVIMKSEYRSRLYSTSMEDIIEVK